MSVNTENSVKEDSNYRLPSGTTLQHCAKLSIVEDKPIMSMFEKSGNQGILVA